jgi:hypothetical protein
MSKTITAAKTLGWGLLIFGIIGIVAMFNGYALGDVAADLFFVILIGAGIGLIIYARRARKFAPTA